MSLFNIMTLRTAHAIQNNDIMASLDWSNPEGDGGEGISRTTSSTGA